MNTSHPQDDHVLPGPGGTSSGGDQHHQPPAMSSDDYNHQQGHGRGDVQLGGESGQRKGWKGKLQTTAVKKHFIAALGEFVGTTLFLLFALGGATVANTPPTKDITVAINQDANTSALLYISLSFGLSLAVCSWVFFRVSGGLFNPAVSLGLVLVGGITPLRGAILTVAQLAGGIAAAGLTTGLLGIVDASTTLRPGTSIARGLFLEMFLTTMLMLTILLLAAEKHKATFLAPIGIGLALFIAEMVGVFYTGGSLNPCRSFGPAAVTGSFPGYFWIYFLGPYMGAALASAFYLLMKYLHYEIVNPHQDATDDAEAEAALAEASHMQRVRSGSSDMTTVNSPNSIARSRFPPSLLLSLAHLPPFLSIASQNTTFADLQNNKNGPFDQANRLERLERKMDQLVGHRKGEDKKLDAILEKLAAGIESEDYWRLGEEGREAKGRKLRQGGHGGRAM